MMMFLCSQPGAKKLDIITAVIIITMTFGQRAGKGFYNKVLMSLNKVWRTQREPWSGLCACVCVCACARVSQQTHFYQGHCSHGVSLQSSETTVYLRHRWNHRLAWGGMLRLSASHQSLRPAKVKRKNRDICKDPWNRWCLTQPSSVWPSGTVGSTIPFYK